MELGGIVTLIITGLGAFASGAWMLAKGKLKKSVKLGSEIIDVAKALESALEDDKVDKKEIEVIKKEFAEVKDAWKALIRKE